MGSKSICANVRAKSTSVKDVLVLFGYDIIGLGSE